MKQKLLLLLVLLLTATTGAMAQAAITSDLADSYDAKVGSPITLSIEASNAQYYQWYKKYPQGNAMLMGATSSSYTFTPKEAGETKFFCAVYGYNNDYAESKVTTVIATVPPTYSVTLAEGTEDANKWTIEPTEAAEGTTVTATYSGEKKVKSVKAVKKAAGPAYTLLSAATTSDIGKVVCAAGHLHDAKTAVPDGCTAVGILGKVTATGHGLILALKDAPEQEWNTINDWTSASYAGTTLKVLPDDDARGTNLTSYTTLGATTVSNWAVAQIEDYDAIFINLGSTTNVGGGYTCDGNVNAYITTGVGGAAITYGCWSATEYDNAEAWYFYSEYWSQDSKDDENRRVRPVLGF